jgi:hypothetical protein
MSVDPTRRRQIVAEVAEARASVEAAAAGEVGTVMGPDWPMRPVLDLCVLTLALLARVNALERKIDTHVAATGDAAHPPF